MIIDKKISVVVCTRNRSASLGLTLSCLNQLNRPQGWVCQFVFVDNGSSDPTAQILSDFAKSSRFDCLLLSEPRAGLSMARNKALECISDGVIAFTDDDCCPCVDWLERIAAHFDTPECAQVLGGRVELYDELDLPVSINPDPKAHEITGFTSQVTGIMGCNLSFSAELAQNVGHFDANLGAGAKFLSAEDTDFNTRCLRAGHSIKYDPTVLVYHNHGRRTDLDRLKIYRGYARGRGALYAKNYLSGETRALKEFYWELRSRLFTALPFSASRANKKPVLPGVTLELVKGFVLGFFHYFKRWPRPSAL